MNLARNDSYFNNLEGVWRFCMFWIRRLGLGYTRTTEALSNTVLCAEFDLTFLDRSELCTEQRLSITCPMSHTCTLSLETKITGNGEVELSSFLFKFSWYIKWRMCIGFSYWRFSTSTGTIYRSYIVSRFVRSIGVNF